MLRRSMTRRHDFEEIMLDVEVEKDLFCSVLRVECSTIVNTDSVSADALTWHTSFGSAQVLDSSAVEHPAVNRRVVGSNPTRGA